MAIRHKEPIPRTEILRRLRENIANGVPIIGAGAGIGLSAKCEEAGGADMIICYNSGRFRMQGRASVSGAFPMGDANGTVVELGYEILPLIDHTPVIAGVYAHDSYRFLDLFLEDLRRMGFSGVQNFPCNGCFSGAFAAELENVGFSFQNEVELIRLAHEMDFFTSPYVYNEDHIEKMMDAGADILVVHVGGTNGGMIGVGDDVSQSLDETIVHVQKLRDFAVSIDPNAIVIAHGGPLSTPKEVEYFFQRTHGIAGFFGASSAERLPTEVALTQCIRDYKSIRVVK